MAGCDCEVGKRSVRLLDVGQGMVYVSQHALGRFTKMCTC
jgi:hypothetical protein